MISNYIGDEIFWKGLNLFLEKFQYSCAITRDLWSCLSEATNYSILIDSIMNDWIQFPKHPILYIQIIHQDKNNITFSIIQLYAYKFQSEIDINNKNLLSKFKIPLCIKQQHNQDVLKYLMDTSIFHIQIPCKENEWISFNWGHYGFYR